MQQVSPTLQTTSNDVSTEVREKKTQCNLTTLVTNDQAFKALGDTAGQEQEKTRFFLIYSSRFLDGFERLSAEATFRTPAHTAKM